MTSLVGEMGVGKMRVGEMNPIPSGRVISLSVCLSVCPWSFSNEGLVEGLVQDRSVRIQHLHNSQTRDPLERLRKAV